ncbi:hypothetical protein GA0115239_113218 [Streptomyces sp. BpilaLS-43]|nr:hypothetical protein GA0115239_113218 [Streptomyces sp. BpilaLS-43]
MQERWLTLLTTHPDLAAPWKPAHMPVEEYVKLLNANQQFCAVTLRYRLGLTTKERLRFYATSLMKNENVQQYWEAFGTLREEEVLGDNRATTSTRPWETRTTLSCGRRRRPRASAPYAHPTHSKVRGAETRGVLPASWARAPVRAGP